MALNALIFPAIVSVFCIPTYALPRRGRYVWLLLCGYALFLFSAPQQSATHVPAFAALFCTTLLSYLCALFMQQGKHKAIRIIWLCVALLCSLVPWFVFKFLGGVANAPYVGQGASLALSFAVPISLSYYTLQTISYTISVFNDKCKAENNLLLYALYVSFFPAITSGPISSAKNMLEQYRAPAAFNYKQIMGGLFRMLWGFFKKMMIADALARFTLAVLGAPESYTGPELLIAALLFPYQLTVDFSAYSDIAIGAAKMLGITLPENFLRPFASKTISEFLHRWHRSFSLFLQRYVFEPIRTRGGTFCLVLACFATCIAAAFFHGAHAGFFISVFIAGAFFLISKLCSGIKEKIVAHIPLYRIPFIRSLFQRLFVFLLCAFCMVFFASALFGTSFTAWFANLGNGWVVLSSGMLPARLMRTGFARHAFLTITSSTLLVSLVEKFAVTENSTISEWIRRRKWFVRWPLYFVLLIGILLFGVLEENPFIFQML